MYPSKYRGVTPQVLLNAMQGEINGISYYEQLQEMAPDPQDKELIQSIHTDERNHYKSLAGLYRRMTGTAPQAQQPQPPEIQDYAQGIKAAILDELRDSEFYRGLALKCNNPCRPMFYDIMADETKHAAWLNYLYLKSLESCCCQTEVPGPGPGPEPGPEPGPWPEPGPEPGPGPGPEPGPQPIVCEGIAHTVQPGDSLWGIGAKYAVSVEELLSSNPQITDPGNIYTGQIICIPCSGISYTIQAGDSLWSIGQRYNLTPDDLTAANPFLTDPANISVGQIICIPCCNGEPLPVIPRESLTYMYGGTSTYYLDLLANTQDSINVVCPDFFEIDENGYLLIASPIKLNAQFIDALHQQGIRVTPFISNHFDRERGIVALSNRELLSSQLASAVEEYNLDGVNVDIENVNQEYRGVYVDFVRMLREKLPEGKIVSVAVAANPNNLATGWHGSYDYNGLAQYSDYLFIMDYDESYQGGPEGPVSSSGFFERSIQYALEQGVPAEKIVVGIPFFGRYWKQGETSGGIGLAARDVQNLLDNYSGSQFYDEATQSALVVVTILPGQPEPTIWGGRKLTAGTYRIWFDTPQATRYKLEVINRYGVRGAGSWALGQEIPEIWDFYTETLNQ